MSERTIRIPTTGNITRRLAITRTALAFGCISVVPARLSAQTAMQKPDQADNSKRTSIHYEIVFTAIPQRIYDVLLDAKQFSVCTGMAAEIDSKEGGAFSLFRGMVVGRNVELVPGRRVVQAWRPSHWDEGVYSIVRFELKPQGTGTLLVFDHTGFPEGEYHSLDTGWPTHYWDRIKKFLA
jgi:activator of HSP90 ATPase